MCLLQQKEWQPVFSSPQPAVFPSSPEAPRAPWLEPSLSSTSLLLDAQLHPEVAWYRWLHSCHLSQPPPISPVWMELP